MLLHVYLNNTAAGINFYLDKATEYYNSISVKSLVSNLLSSAKHFFTDTIPTYLSSKLFSKTQDDLPKTWVNEHDAQLDAATQRIAALRKEIDDLDKPAVHADSLTPEELSDDDIPYEDAVAAAFNGLDVTEEDRQSLASLVLDEEEDDDDGYMYDKFLPGQDTVYSKFTPNRRDASDSDSEDDDELSDDEVGDDDVFLTDADLTYDIEYKSTPSPVRKAPLSSSSSEDEYQGDTESDEEDGIYAEVVAKKSTKPVDSNQCPIKDQEEVSFYEQVLSTGSTALPVGSLRLDHVLDGYFMNSSGFEYLNEYGLPLHGAFHDHFGLNAVTVC